MAIFLTGATGYIGSYLAAGFLEKHGEPLNVLVRAGSADEAERRIKMNEPGERLGHHADARVMSSRSGATLRSCCGASQLAVARDTMGSRTSPAAAASVLNGTVSG